MAVVVTTFTGGSVSLTKADVGLANVDNTADLNKPVSAAQAAADAASVAAAISAASALVGVTPYVLAATNASSGWLTTATATVDAGVDCAAALSAAFASGRKHIQIAGTLSLLSAVSVTPVDNMWLEFVEGAYIQCGPQVGADPNDPPVLLTIGGTRATMTTSATLPITAGVRTATFGSVGSVVAGDYVMLHTATLFGPNRSNEFTGEMIRVESVSGLTLRFTRPVRYTYPAAVAFTMARYTSMPQWFRTNIDIRGDETSLVRQQPLVLEYMRDVTLDGTRVSQGLACESGIRCEEIHRLHFNDCWGERVCDAHGSSGSYTGAATTTTASVAIGATSVTVTSSTGFPILQSGFAWLGNPGAVDTEFLIAFTAVIGGEPVRVINVVGTTWTLAAGFVSAHASGVAVTMNGSHTGYAYHIVGCSHVTGSISGRSGRHLWDVKSVNTRPCAFNVKLTGHAYDFASSPFSTHGSCDQVGWTDATSEGCGGHEVFRGLHHHSIRGTCIHPTRWTRGIFDKHQAYAAMTWVGEGVDDGGLGGDGFVWEDGYLDAASCPFSIAGVWIRDQAVGVRITGRRYFAPNNTGVWLAGPSNSGLIDIAVYGTTQTAAPDGTPEGAQGAVQFRTETGGTAGMSVRSMDVRVDDRGVRGPMLFIEGNATDSATLNGEVSVVGYKVALGTGQTSASAQIVRGAGYHQRLNADVQLPDTLFASALSTVDPTKAKRPAEWSRGSRFSDGRADTWNGSGSDRMGVTGPKRVGSLAWTGDPTLFASATALTTGRLETAELWVPAGTITDIRYLVSVAGVGVTAGQSFAMVFAAGAAGSRLAITADQATNLASTAGTVITAALTSSYVHTGGYLRVGIYSVFATTAPQLLRGASNQGANTGTVAPFRFSHSGATVYTTTAPSTLPTMTSQTNSWWFELVGTPT